MTAEYRIKFYVLFVTKVGSRCALYKRDYRVMEGSDDWQAYLRATVDNSGSHLLRSFLRRLITKRTTMGEAEKKEAVTYSNLSWTVNVPNINSYSGEQRSVSDIFNRFKSLTRKRTMRMTLLFVNFCINK